MNSKLENQDKNKIAKNSNIGNKDSIYKGI